MIMGAFWLLLLLCCDLMCHVRSQEWKTEAQEKIVGWETPFTLWPKAQVPFLLSSDVTDNSLKGSILRAMQELSKKTCVTFVPRTKVIDPDIANDYVLFQAKSGCGSSIGRVGGKQIVNLGEGCRKMGNILHQLMHALGFFHEHSRMNRDEHVVVFLDNVKFGKENIFGKHDGRDLGDFDYDSIMMFGSDFFSRNGMPTILTKTGQPIKPYTRRNVLSVGDVKKVNRLYCQKPKLPPPPPAPTCRDHYTFCPSIKQNCDQVMDKCCQTCRRSNTPPPPVPIISATCKDHYSFCPSCQTCRGANTPPPPVPTIAATCKDHYSFCPSLILECKHVKEECCLTCSKGPPPATTTSTPCEDTFPLCAAILDRCEHVWKRCCKSCSAIGVGGPRSTQQKR